MSTGFIFALVGLVAAVAAVIVWRRWRGSDGMAEEAWVAGVIAVGVGVPSVFALVMCCLTMVDTKKVGVITAFGRPTGTLPNGVHVVAPWSVVTELDGAIQTDTHAGDGKDGGCTTVRLQGQATACVDNSVRWRIRLEAADALFRDYRDFDRIRDSLVTRELRAALNDVFSTFDPLAGITAPTAGPKGSGLDGLGEAVTTKLRARIGTQVEVLNTIIPLVRYDGGTEERIRAFQVALADTRIAVQREETARAEARANAALAASVTNNTGVLVSKCLDEVREARKAGYGLPAGYSCWPGGTGVGLTAAVK